MSLYTNPFGGGTVTPSSRSLTNVALSAATLRFIWPGYAATASDVPLADIVRITDTSGAPRSMNLPDATLAGEGTAILFGNQGAFSVTVRDSSSAVICDIAPSEFRLVLLVDNANASGVWLSVLYGVGMGALDAGAAAGFGLSASGSQLQLNLPVVSFSSDYTITPTDRATLYVWTGGVGTLTLPAVASVGAGFPFAVRNQGTGTVTVAAAGGELIDGLSAITLQPQESASIRTNGSSAWFSVGRGRNQQFNFTLLALPVTGGTVTLTATQAANIVQRFTGTLTSNAIIQVPPVVQCYYISNATTGAFTLTYRVTGGGGASVVVPQNQNVVLFCDGTNILQTTTVVSGLTALTLALGSLSAPAILFNDGSQTGIYSPAGGTVSLSSNARDVMRFTGSASAVNYLQATAAVTGARVTLAAAGTDTNIGVNINTKGTGNVIFNASANIGIGGVTTPTNKVDVTGSIGLSGNVIFVAAATDYNVRVATVDAADNARLILSSAGVAADTRGAHIILAGNEAAANPGRVSLVSGAGSDISLTTARVAFPAGAVDRVIAIDTVDAADNARLQLCGAGSSSFSRGASVLIAGNEYALNGGRLTLLAGASENVVVERGNLLVANGGALGYTVGSGGTVTQLTNKNTPVTLDKSCGRIIMASGNIAAGGFASFTVNCNVVSQFDFVGVCLAAGGAGQNYTIGTSSVGAGSFVVFVRNETAGVLNDVLELNFSIKKGTNS